MNLPFITYNFITSHCYKPELSPSAVWRREESLDSIGQPTGEEPGVSLETTESATENNCLSHSPPVERVGVRVKM
ncbi:hypothetical protein BH10BAC2_BH10BAC2_09960 [soil metagenome]